MQQTIDLEMVYKKLHEELRTIESDRIRRLIETVRKNETIILKQADTIEALRDEIKELKKRAFFLQGFWDVMHTDQPGPIPV